MRRFPLFLFVFMTASAGAAGGVRLVNTVTGTDSGSCIVSACKTIEYAKEKLAPIGTLCVDAGSGQHCFRCIKDICKPIKTDEK